ncbi:CPBP family intramembrane metalloprotease [Nodosilinea sp. LEGE 07298]|uniref:CPBP family intramembrane glutamic endopeptidase n=1 Tax=Nodosilinea sp. LEGE 07298 TaxID=2777970 RepID=UPI001880E0FA|nr:CPBP family intramembrane glutamic endopeptidase [Nodosilinea sp. LEGE 07298]MBE9107982.1 CPBP family intramembrane metalloprotease [Nodosilinea sp. LEGE 07298]
MALGIPASLLVARIGQIPLTYPVAQQHKLPLLLPLYLLAPVAVEIHRRLEAGTWSDYGIAWNQTFWTLMLVGFAIAASGVVALVALQVGLGWRRWQSFAQAPITKSKSPEALGPNQDAPAPSPGVVLLAVLPLALFVGWIEELIFRGVLVNGLGQAWPVWLMAIAVSLIFAVSHLVWDGPAGAPQLPGLTVMGAVLLLARWVAGGSLGLAWGLHAGWVFAIAAIDALALLKPGKDGPVWLVGLPDQPLTGALPMGLLVLTGVGLWVFG